jgi:hypothetical protein
MKQARDQNTAQPKWHWDSDLWKSTGTLNPGDVRRSLLDSNLHSMMPLSCTPLLRLKRCQACNQCHSSRVFTPLIGCIVNSVQTLKADDEPGDYKNLGYSQSKITVGIRFVLGPKIIDGLMEKLEADNCRKVLTGSQINSDHSRDDFISWYRARARFLVLELTFAL